MTTLNQPAAAAPAKALLGTKLGMTQIWDENGVLRPVTVVRVDTNVVTQVRTIETDGYEAVQLAFGEIAERKVTKPLAGHFAKAGVAPRRHVAEVRTSLASEFEAGQELTADLFEVGQKVDVQGTSKGKGFAGVMKRHGFAGVSASHGAHRNHRKPGSIGACATPGRIFKGLRMAGRMGHETTTVQNLKVRGVDVEKGVLLVNGAIPGPKGSVVVDRSEGSLTTMADALTVDIVDSKGKKTGSAELPAEIFDVETNIPLMHQVVVAQLAAARQGTHATKTRGAVRGGGRKPYRQKGTGRARQGSTRAPQFVGGGTVHGPQPRDYSQRTPKKMKAAALRSALSDRARNGRIHVITEFVTSEKPSTKSALGALRNITDRKALVVATRADELTALSLRNAPEALVIWADQLNTYDVLVNDDVVFTAAALDSFLGKGEEESK